MIFQEDDERFWVNVDLTRSERFILVEVGSKTTSEVYYLPASAPLDPLLCQTTTKLPCASAATAGTDCVAVV